MLAENFRNQFTGDVSDKSKFVCDTYFRCLVNTINLGLRGGGGVSDYMNLESNYLSHRFTSRWFFDLFFFIFINLILLGIFFGIIVDSFAEYWDEINKRTKDLENNCLSCGLSRAQLEKKRISFEEHIKNEHYIYNYYFYIEYLDWKPNIYYDGVDIFVSEILKSNYKNAWIPKENTMALQK